MPNVIGFEKGYWVKTCAHCGSVFRTRNGDKPHCNVCAGRIAQAERLHEMSVCKGTARGGKPQKNNTTADITRLSKLAAEHGMSYGKYVAKYGK